MSMFVLLLIALPVIFASVNPLGPYNVKDVTVSGLSSGAYMAVQLHVTYSSIVNGSAIFAGVSLLSFVFFCCKNNCFSLRGLTTAPEEISFMPRSSACTPSWAPQILGS
jgi:poly(3-hydroxybutyrate) depolymerase